MAKLGRAVGLVVVQANPLGFRPATDHGLPTS